MRQMGWPIPSVILYTNENPFGSQSNHQQPRIPRKNAILDNWLTLTHGTRKIISKLVATSGNCSRVSHYIAQWKNEHILLSVRAMARAMIAHLKNEWISLAVLSMARVQVPAVAEYFKGFSLAVHTLLTNSELAWQKMAHSSIMVNSWSLVRELSLYNWILLIVQHLWNKAHAIVTS